MGTVGIPTIRAVMLRLLRLPVAVGQQIGITPTQWTALLDGSDATVTSVQLRMFGAHPSKPSEAELDANPLWTLSGDSTLTPAP